MRSRTPGRRESFLIFTGLPPKKVLVKVYWGDRKKERLSFRGNKEIADRGDACGCNGRAVCSMIKNMK